MMKNLLLIQAGPLCTHTHTVDTTEHSHTHIRDDEEPVHTHTLGMTKNLHAHKHIRNDEEPAFRPG